ncbi:charged multivesicular body protein 4b [Oryzias latipes]|uniref:charged multivesicular body protein 4b n=1 Tax=Oryzias latipes TaxID=8090 RepID=UPI0005CBF372|nr:charged multivesicular body protein 4b [Oryzias latipes]
MPAIMSSCGVKVRNPAASPQIQGLLVKNAEPSQNNIKQELWWAKKDRRINQRVVLQPSNRRKSSQKHLQHFSCAFKTMRSALEHAEIINRMNDLINDSMKTEDATPDVSDYLSVNEEEFDENLLLAELEKLEKSLDENLFEADRKEDLEFLAASPSHLAKLEEEEEEEEEDIEEDLEYLRQWANSL